MPQERYDLYQVPSYGRKVPNFTSIPTVNPVGDAAQANAFNDVARGFSQFSQNLQTIVNEQSLIEAERKGKIQGFDPEADPNKFGDGTGDAGERYRAAATQSYLARQGMDFDKKISEAAAKYPLEPGKFSEEMKSYIDGATKDMPAEIQVMYRSKFEPFVNDTNAKIQNAKVNHDKEISRRNTLARIDELMFQLEQNAGATDPDNQYLNNIRMAELQSHFQSAEQTEVLTQAETSLKLKKLQLDMQKQLVVSQVNKSDVPLSAALSVLDMDGISNDAKAGAVAAAYNKFNIKKMLQGDYERVINEANEQKRLGLAKEIIINPEKALTPEGQKNFDQLKETAGSVSDLEKAVDLEKKLKDMATRPYLESNPAVVASIERAILTGKLPDNEVLGVDYILNVDGLSTKDRTSLIKKYSEQPVALQGNPRFSTFEAQMKKLYPAAAAKNFEDFKQKNYSFEEAMNDPFDIQLEYKLQMQSFENVLFNVRQQMSSEDDPITLSNINERLDEVIFAETQKVNQIKSDKKTFKGVTETSYRPQVIENVFQSYVGEGQVARFGNSLRLQEGSSAGNVYVRGVSPGLPKDGDLIISKDEFNEISKRLVEENAP